MNRNALRALRRTPVLGSILLLACQGGAGRQWSVQSPGGFVTLIVRLEKKAVTAAPSNSKTRLFYAIQAGKSGAGVLESSPMGIRREDQSFSDSLLFEAQSPVRVIDEAVVSPRGKNRSYRLKGNELTLAFRNPRGARLELDLRAYDDGAAFRYRFPETSDTVRTVAEELTGFRIPKAALAFMQPYDSSYQWAPAYETFYRKDIPIGTVSPTGEGWAFPALFRLYGGTQWALITEAAVDGGYFGGRLSETPGGDLYTIRMPSKGEGNGTGEVKPSSRLPWTMPWRVVITGSSLAPIVESNLVEGLNPPSVAADEKWIRPGRVSWSWWSDNASPRNIKALRDFVDLAAEMGWEYSLVDANWNLMEKNAIPRLVQYAKKKGVGILLWYNSGGPHNSVTEQPRDRMFDPAVREREMAWLEKTGVKGVKVDFFQSDKQNVIAQYHGILKDALRYHLLVDFHGCTLPRGWSRTYPNLMSMEAVPGEEQYLFSKPYPETAPWQNTVFAFTRNAVGPMDYTPVGFTETKYPHLTSDAHELALSVVFESGLQHFADRTAAFRSLPDAPKQFLKEVPAAWDETRYVEGEPGRLAVLARRNGTAWFVGGINGEKTGKHLSVPLAFLPQGRYAMTLITDGNNSKSFRDRKAEVKSGESVQVDVLACGGFVMEINPIP
jgi:alpha-glucosidase